MIEEQEKRLYTDIRDILRDAREQAYKNTNKIMTYAYWEVGKKIAEQEQKGEKKAKYGTYLIRRLSKELTDEFGSGFSIANLRNCRQFYLTFPQNSYGFSMIGNLSWSHLRNIKSGYYRRILSTQMPDKPDRKFEFLKDPFILEFMGIKENNNQLESEMENLIISNLQKFLLEMGKGFSFVSRQMRICTETTDFYIDLVFYNFILKCFVLIDLKTTKLTHQDIGQMDMYVRMFEDIKRRDDDNPTIGIIFCTDKDETIVKYSVLNENRQIFASKYMTVLPTVEELQRALEHNQLIYNNKKEDNYK